MTLSELSCPLCGRRLDEKLFAGSYTQGIVNVGVECPYCKTVVTIRARINRRKEITSDVIDAEVVEQRGIER